MATYWDPAKSSLGRRVRDRYPFLVPNVGDVIGDKYRLDRLVGEGGMGVVYAATHLPLAQPVALKVVRPDPSNRATATTRLVREARMVASLTSEHVARVQDVGTIADGTPYLVMELLSGATLQAIVSEQGALSVSEASEAIIQACHGLGDAHSHGIIHRDVKPSNLFRTFDGSGAPRVKVIDFGVSKASQGVDDANMLETKTGTLLGSPPFMSPEQIQTASDVDARTDVWSLGVVLYFLVSGKRPFEAQSLLDLMTLIAYEKEASLRTRAPSVPAGFEQVVDRCLQKRRDDRFSGVAELAEALVPFAPGRTHALAARVARVSPSWPGPAALPAPIEAGGTITRTVTAAEPADGSTVGGISTQGTQRNPGRRRWAKAAALALGGAIAVAATVGFSRRERAGEPAPIPASSFAPRIPPTSPAIAPVSSAPADEGSTAVAVPLASGSALPAPSVSQRTPASVARPGPRPRAGAPAAHPRRAAPGEAPLVPSTPD